MKAARLASGVCCALLWSGPTPAFAAAPRPVPAAAQTLGEAAQGLEAREARERRKAAQDLGAIGTLPAFALLLSKGLEDREPMVADEAQWQLGRVASPQVAALVFGRHVLGHRDALLRLRAAEALGRMEVSLDAALWASALKERDPRARRAFLESLGLHAAAQRVTGKLDALRKAVAREAGRGNEDATRGAALAALAQLDPSDARKLADEWARAKEPTLRAAAFEAWLAMDPASAVTHAAAVLDDAHGPLRARAVAALVAHGSRAAVNELVGRLEREDSVRVRAALLAGLRGLSGLRHGADPRPWREWLEALPADWHGAADSASAPGKGDAALDAGDGRSTTFVGHAVRSDRVAFLIDMSGSMWTEANGATRKQRVEHELAKALRALPSTARFNIIPYADLPAPFEKGLIEASAANVERAIKAFERSTQRGKGDVWGAIVSALDDPEVDTLVILTDGAPSGGERWNVELMAHLYARENRLRYVAVDVVLFGAKKNLVKLWRALAEASGGRATEVEL
ncbi:MAG: hypothetical protein R3F49_11840 [Planctomycetota bacterium]